MNIASSGKKIDTNDKTVADINSAPASMGLPRPPVDQLAGIQPNFNATDVINNGTNIRNPHETANPILIKAVRIMSVFST